MACMLALSPALMASDSIAACAAIKNAADRLECYDRIAHRAQIHPAPPGPSAGNGPATSVETPRSAPPIESSTEIPEQPSPDSGHDSEEKMFGLRHSNADQGDRISSNLDTARRDNLRRYVFTLSNGQVWEQREPGDRPIRAGQPVTITRRRWSYAMFLESQNFWVTVERVK